MVDDDRIKTLAREAYDRATATPHIPTGISIIADAIRTALNEYAETLKSQDVYHELAFRAEHLDILKTQLAEAREALEGIDDCFRKGHYAEGALMLRSALVKIRKTAAGES